MPIAPRRRDRCGGGPAFLEAMQPAQLEVSMAAIAQMARQARRVDRQWELIVERRATRRSWPGAVPGDRPGEPPGRADLGAGLGSEAGRGGATGAGIGHPALGVDPPGGPGGASPVLALAQDLPAVWNAKMTTNVDRKQLLGFLIKDVCLTRAETTIEMSIRWQTEACTVLSVPRPRRSCDASPDRPRRPRTIACLGDRHLRSADRRDPRSGGVPLGYRASVHAEHHKTTEI